MTDMTKNKSKKIKSIINYVTIFALLVLVWALRKQLATTLDDLLTVKLWAIGLMPLAQAANYWAYANFYQDMFEILKEKINFRELLKITLELNFVNNVFPSGGVTGISYFGLRLKDQGVSPGKATIVQMFKFVLLFLSFQILLGVGLLLLAIGGQANGLLLLFAGSLSTLLVIFTVFFGYVLASENRINAFFGFFTNTANKLIHIVRPKHPETIKTDNVKKLFSEVHHNYMLIKNDIWVLKRPMLLMLMANITEVLTVYLVYIAFGHPVNPGAVIIGYAVANFAGLVSVLPGGVGVYEALMVLVTTAAGVEPELALSVTIMYRVINTAVQLIPGYYYYRKHLRKET
jgi:uncharacterized protein (TIRG00374 family)